MRQRVVITGLGCISPLGLNVPETWENIVAGVSGVGPITRFDASDFKTRFAAEVKGFDANQIFGRREARRMDRFTHFAVAAAREAVEQAGLDFEQEDRDRIGAIVGSGIGGIGTMSEQLEVLRQRGPTRVNPFLVPMMISDTAAGMLAIYFGIRGVNLAVASACATGTNAVGEAMRVLQRGDADVMLAGGAEAAIVPLAMAGMGVIHAMSTRNEDPQRASRPFDLHRDGFVMGEGAAILVLETLEHARQRGARILAELVGYGTSDDAYHISAPAEDGGGAALCMRLALQDAGLAPEAIDYINAHGTSTRLNDRSETMAIKQVFGEHAYRLAVSSTKSMTGHLLGASGALEAVFCVRAIQDGILPPTINYETPDPECDLDYVPNEARPAQPRYVLSNSFGFGGHNATIVLKRYEEA